MIDFHNCKWLTSCQDAAFIYCRGAIFTSPVRIANSYQISNKLENFVVPFLDGENGKTISPTFSTYFT